MGVFTKIFGEIFKCLVKMKRRSLEERRKHIRMSKIYMF